MDLTGFVLVAYLCTLGSLWAKELGLKNQREPESFFQEIKRKSQGQLGKVTRLVLFYVFSQFGLFTVWAFADFFFYGAYTEKRWGVLVFWQGGVLMINAIIYLAQFQKEKWKRRITGIPVIADSIFLIAYSSLFYFNAN